MFQQTFQAPPTPGPWIWRVDVITSLPPFSTEVRRFNGPQHRLLLSTAYSIHDTEVPGVKSPGNFGGWPMLRGEVSFLFSNYWKKTWKQSTNDWRCLVGGIQSLQTCSRGWDLVRLIIRWYAWVWGEVWWLPVCVSCKCDKVPFHNMMQDDGLDFHEQSCTWMTSIYQEYNHTMSKVYDAESDIQQCYLRLFYCLFSPSHKGNHLFSNLMFGHFPGQYSLAD